MKRVAFIYQNIPRGPLCAGVLVLGLIAILGLAATPHDPGQSLWELEIAVGDPTVQTFMAEHDLDVERSRYGWVRVYVSDTEKAQLDSAGIAYTILNYSPPLDKSKKLITSDKVIHSYDNIGTALNLYATNYPSLCRLYTIGQSVEGRELWVVHISDNPDLDEEEPEFKYVSSMHGNETVGVEMCLNLIELLLTEYGSTPRITSLVDETSIWIMPLMNPDGYMLNGTINEAYGRYNADGYDLNRSFPELQAGVPFGTVYDGDPLNETGRPIEVRRMMQWSAVSSFVLSANIHGGALLVNYPYDADIGIPLNTYAACPDDDLLIDLSERYSITNSPMWNGSFFHGISNGSDWYTIYDGMQDWHYRYLSCFEVTLELSNIKNPDPGTIPGFWDDNRESMLAYMEAVHIGVRGIVSDADTSDPVYAKITVLDNDQPVYTDPDVGDYYRLLLPGTYTLEFSAPGYVTQQVEDVAVVDGVATLLDIELAPPPPHSADSNEDLVIDLSEFLRVVQLHQAGGYHCAVTTSEDGFLPGAETLTCDPHDADYNPQDGVISLTELQAVAQLYLATGYTICAENPDQYCAAD